jgi:hypothetical protein
MFVSGSSLSRQMQISKDSFGAFRRYIDFVTAECVGDDSENESKRDRKKRVSSSAAEKKSVLSP